MTIAAPSNASEGFSPAEVTFFHHNGYVITRGLADPAMLESMRQVTLDGLRRQVPPLEYEADLSYPGAPVSREARGGDTVRRLKDAFGRDPVFTRWVKSEGVRRRLQQLLGREVVMPLAHHNCIMTKQPRFSSETHWHQDIRYWSFQRPDLVSLWLALGQETLENGGLMLIPGSHTGSLPKDRFDAAMFLRGDHPDNQPLIETRVSAALEAGDALFFHARTFHAAGKNQTDRPKFSVVFTFRPADNPPLPNSRSASMPEVLLPVE